MLKFVTTSVGRLRLYAFLEGLSLLLLVFIAVPLKYLYTIQPWSKYWVPSMVDFLFYSCSRLFTWGYNTNGSFSAPHGKSCFRVLSHSAHFISTIKFSDIYSTWFHM